jgi:hypothetical protein
VDFKQSPNSFGDVLQNLQYQSFHKCMSKRFGGSQ